MLHQKIKALAHSHRFCHLVNYAIIAFAILVGIETVFKGPDLQFAFRILDFVFLGFFTFEVIVRIFAEDHPADFFILYCRKTVNGKRQIEFNEHGFWNYFDFSLIALSIFGITASVFIHPSFMQIGRLFRIFRIIRLFEISEHLKQVEKRIMSIMPTVFSFIILLLILNYIYAVLGMFMFGQHVFATANFTNIFNAFVTLFQIMTLDNWSDVMHDLSATSGLNPVIIQVYFVSFVVFTSIIAFNVFIAVMTSQVQHKMETDLEEKVAEEVVSDGRTHEELKRNMEEVVNELQQLRKAVEMLNTQSSKHKSI